MEQVEQPITRRARQKVDVVALLASHNRKLRTLRCLESFFAQSSEGSRAAVLVDDASSDGTAAEVRQRFPHVEVVEGSGSLFWGGGMRLATQIALARFEARFHLWLNDDVTLLDDALERLLRTSRDGEPRRIVAGSVRDPDSGSTTYSGLVRVNPRHPFRFRLVEPTAGVQLCETMNGNVVLLPVQAVSELGTVDADFPHNIGDVDYGLRATKKGWEVVLAPHHVGTCRDNPMHGTYEDPSLPLAQRFRHLRSQKGLPLRAWVRYTRRHGGRAWPLFTLLPYLGILASTVPLTRRKYLARKGFDRPVER